MILEFLYLAVPLTFATIGGIIAIIVCEHIRSCVNSFVTFWGITLSMLGIGLCISEYIIHGML